MRDPTWYCSYVRLELVTNHFNTVSLKPHVDESAGKISGLTVSEAFSLRAVHIALVSYIAIEVE